MENEKNYNILIISEYDSGKTNFIYAYVYNKHEKMTPRTMLYNPYVKTMNFQNKLIKIKIFDSPSGFYGLKLGLNSSRKIFKG